jgi:hypothetical protein
MAHVSGSMTIRRPVETVFDYAANQCNEPTYNPRMVTSEKVSEGPVGVSTHFRATVLSGRRPLDMDIKVTEYDRPTRFGTHTAMSSADVIGVLTFRPSADVQVLGHTTQGHGPFLQPTRRTDGTTPGEGVLGGPETSS